MRTKLVLLPLILLGLMAACPATPATGPARPRPREAMPPMVPGSLKVFEGGQGIKVAMLKLKDGRWLVRITGTTSKVDAKVLPCHYERDGTARQIWWTRYNGQQARVITLHLRRMASPFYRLSVPGEGFLQYIKLRYSEAATRALRPQELWAQHRAQVADGSLAAIARFHVKARIQREERYLARYARRLAKACGSRVKLTLQWDTVRHKTPKTMRLSGPCSAPAHALRDLCRWAVVRRAVKQHLKEIRCHLGPKTRFELRGDVLYWTAEPHERNRDLKARKRIAEGLRFAQGEPLARQIYREQTTMCTDGKGHFVGLRPRRKPDAWTGMRSSVFFGTPKGLTLVPPVGRMADGYFFDPRFRNRKRHYARWIGDRRYIHSFELDRRGRGCTLTCGTRRIALKRVDPARVNRLMKGVSWKPGPARRRPYGLARDRKGVYYYVDRADAKGARDFRLYKGPLGKLRRLKMINIVSDSQGDVFSTRNGSLRLVLEKEHSYWIRRGRKTRLINVPLGDNLQLIFNELGVYLGKPYGTPCDLF